MVQEALVGELLEQASAALTVCELCCERRGYTQARRSLGTRHSGARDASAPRCIARKHAPSVLALGDRAFGQRSSRQAKQWPHALAAAARQAGERGPGVQAFAKAGVVGPLVGLLEREGQCQAASARPVRARRV